MSVKGIKIGEISGWKQNFPEARDTLLMTDQNTVIGLQEAPLAKWKLGNSTSFHT